MDALKNINVVLNVDRIGPTTASLTNLPKMVPAGVDIYQQGEDLAHQSKSNQMRRIEACIDKFLAETDVQLEFSRKKDTGGIVARVVHQPSGKIIREYPVISIFKFFGGINKKV
jgi:hypothetical protein